MSSQARRLTRVFNNTQELTKVTSKHPALTGNRAAPGLGHYPPGLCTRAVPCARAALACIQTLSQTTGLQTRQLSPKLTEMGKSRTEVLLSFWKFLLA